MCLICDRITQYKQMENPYFIHEFEHSIFVLGDHQYFDGYGVLLYKEHIRDITDLPLEIQKEFFAEVMIAGKALQKRFSPYRLNYSCLGNVVEHVHFHIFPRYEQELESVDNKNPWANSNNFNDKKISDVDAKKLALKIKDSVLKVLGQS